LDEKSQDMGSQSSRGKKNVHVNKGVGGHRKAQNWGKYSDSRAQTRRENPSGGKPMPGGEEVKRRELNDNRSEKGISY